MLMNLSVDFNIYFYSDATFTKVRLPNDLVGVNAGEEDEFLHSDEDNVFF